MSEEMILRHCSPTLARIKTANLFSCSVKSNEELKSFLRKFNKQFSKKGLRILPLKYKDGRALIYVYRPNMLLSDFEHQYANKTLTDLGYCTKSPNKCIGRLIKRMEECVDFPHEIGFFLGYPAEDVHGFIEKGPRQCKCTGCWKVYSDEDRAKKLFEKYKKCSSIYALKWADGYSLDRLTVSA